MFIAHFKNGTHFSESESEGRTWDDMPNDGITSLELKLPFSLNMRKDNGEVVKLTPPSVVLSGFDDYYFFNEAVAAVMVDQATGKYSQATQGEKVAQVIAGIDRTRGIVLEVRVDKRGNVKNTITNLEDLEARFIDPETRVGSFDPACIRKGK